MANSKENISSYATSLISFDEASGSAYDSIGGYEGTLYSAPTRVTGWNDKGKAISFNGTGQKVKFANLKIENVLSIRFKIKTSTKNAYFLTDIKEPMTGAHLGFVFLISETGKLTVEINKNMTTYFGFSSKKTITDGKWHDIYVSWSGVKGEKLNIFIDDMEEVDSSHTTTLSYDKNHAVLVLGQVENVATKYFKGELDQIEIYNKIISLVPDKYLVLHDNQYKYYDSTAWKTTTATEENFLRYGMDNFSHITETHWGELLGNKSVVMWSDFEYKEQAIISSHTEPFSVYDHISETPELIIYNESTDDITISTTTEPYDLYDEFGDEVEVLYYTDDEYVTEANLEITANWSPLDELEGDFEIVTWTDEPADTAKRELEIEGLHSHEYVPMTNWIDVKNLVGISIKNVTGVFAPFLIEKKNDPKRYAYYKGYFYPTTEDAHSIHNYGLTPTIINALTKEKWEEFLGGEEEIKFHFLFSNRSIGTVSKSASLDVIHQIGQIQVLRSITKSTPTVTKLELEASVYSMAGRLESIERINLNNLLELELRTSILLKMPLLQSKEMIIETFDSNEYEVAQTMEQLVEIPSTGVDADGNPMPPTWETIIVAKPSDYNSGSNAFTNEFKVSIPINISDNATKMILQISGSGVSLALTDGTTTKELIELYSEEIDVASMNKETLVLQATGSAGSIFKGIAYTWS